jgi:hypothetical protein
VILHEILAALTVALHAIGRWLVLRVAVFAC